MRKLPCLYLLLLLALLFFTQNSLNAESKKASSQNPKQNKTVLKTLLPKTDKAAQDKTPDKTPRDSTLLKVLIQHNVKLPPLPPSLQIGSIYKSGSLEAEKTGSDQWYEVPAWFAGEYAYGVMNTYKVHDYRTGKDRAPYVKEALKGGRVRGLFKDSKGGIWQVSYGGEVSTDSDETYRIETELVGNLISSRRYVESSTGIQVDLNSSDRRIKSASRYERIRTFDQSENGDVLASLSEKWFDDKGKAIGLECSKGKMHRVQLFEEIAPGEWGQDRRSYGVLARDFVLFLRESNQQELIPERFKEIAASQAQAEAEKQKENAPGKKGEPEETP